MTLSSKELLISTRLTRKQVQATDTSDDSLCSADVFTLSSLLVLRAVRPHHAEGHEGLPVDPQ